jgi:hypothetical protein
MALDPEFASLFDDAAAPAPAPEADPFADLDAAPPATQPKPKRGLDIMPACKDCATDLTPDNASKLATGVWVHIGCPSKGGVSGAPAVVIPGDAPANSASVPPPAKAGRKPKAPPADTLTVGGTTVTLGPMLTPERFARALRAFADDLEKP